MLNFVPTVILRLIPSQTHLLIAQLSLISMNCPAAAVMTRFVAWLGFFHHQLAIKEQTRWCLISAYSVFTTHQVCFVHQLLAYHNFWDILLYNWVIIRTLIYCDILWYNWVMIRTEVYCDILWHTVIYCDIIGLS